MLVGSAPPSSPIGVDIEGLPAQVFPGFDDYVLAPSERTSECTNSDRRRLELLGSQGSCAEDDWTWSECGAQ